MSLALDVCAAIQQEPTGDIVARCCGAEQWWITRIALVIGVRACLQQNPHNPRISIRSCLVQDCRPPVPWTAVKERIDYPANTSRPDTALRPSIRVSTGR